MSYTTIQLAHDDAVATITLNRPDRRNAISFVLIDDFGYADTGAYGSKDIRTPHIDRLVGGRRHQFPCTPRRREVNPAM